jgi:eukaryotic-like serine/threonine-protein kinase
MARARDRIAEHTAPGFVKGTLSYMAPEILRGTTASPASDLFSLGATLWEALAGERLFHAKSDPAVIDLIRACKIPPLGDHRPDLPAPLVATIHRMLSPEPDQRQASARAVAYELGEHLREGGPWGDADEIVATAVSQAQTARRNLTGVGP